jgi:predicted small lipoprotein YifL
MIKKTFLTIFLSTFLLTSCGKKGGLETPKNPNRPVFDNLIEEN